LGRKRSRPPGEEAGWRHRGIGRRLVYEVIDAARGRFERLRLRTDGEDASRLYEALGFQALPGAADSTHVLELTP
jgi:GNAT superfamily N-acetyltransferase